MFIDAMGLILADHDHVSLADLTEPRALAAVPFAGRYRIIDFMLSSMVNSGVKNVGVVANFKYRSLMDHLGTGMFWDLDRMQQGLSILPPFITGNKDTDSGDLTGLYDFVHDALQQYVIVSESNMVLNMRFNDYVKRAKDRNAKLTVLYNKDGAAFGEPYMTLGIDNEGLVEDVMFNPKGGPDTTAIGVMIVEREYLLEYLEREIAHGVTTFNIERLLKQYRETPIYADNYDGLILRINSVATYYRASERLLEDDVFADLFDRDDSPIYTKVKNEAPAIYQKGNEVNHSLLSDGCNVAGEVKDSIIFRGVQIARHTKLDGCIIGQDCIIGEGAELTNVILDKDCVIRPGVKLMGQADYPVVIGKGVMV